MFPLRSTFLAQDQVTLVASLCIFSTSSSSLLEPDLLLTADECRSKIWLTASRCTGYRHDMSTPLGPHSHTSSSLAGQISHHFSTDTWELELPEGREGNCKPPSKMHGGTPSSRLLWCKTISESFFVFKKMIYFFKSKVLSKVVVFT